MFYNFLSIYLLLNIVSCETSLKQLHILFRHGERSPTETYPSDPYKNYNWSGGWGHLSNRGKLQMYELGQTLRKQYADFIPTLYWHEDVNVTSSYADRCKMSAQALCAGLFPPKGVQIWTSELLWQPIPVSYLPRERDFIIAMKAKCEKYDKIFDEVMKSEKVKDIEGKYKILFDYLTQHTGAKVTNIGDVEKLYNTLEIEQLNGLELVSWVNETLMLTMKQLGAQNLALYSETEYMKRMKGGAFLQEIFTLMENILEGKAVPILKLYAGHDLTLVHVLRSLNLVDTIKPDFGAYLVFELYSNTEVKILYSNSWDGQPKQLTEENCSPICHLNTLRDNLKNVLPINWSEECNLKKS